MEISASQQANESTGYTVFPEAPVHFPIPASLAPFPPYLQAAIIKAVGICKPRPATDIWYQDRGTGSVYVIRHGIQWQFNKTASFIWMKLGNGVTVKEIVEQLCREYTEDNAEDIEFQTVEFVLHALSYGVLDIAEDEEVPPPGERAES
ncbi:MULTISPECIES: PqqD family protein [Desulfococcus]|jgi:hypothetical protein|uniref:PqqD family protein n=2 Tax=Desulfococcus multivorans TaxID=897 RepID=S7U682_DESML|nr:PqqD family protein [Desulfococcus multivorans]AOY57251.1 uncharacterized protein Dmul_04760 [Desulfococcus multivorans]AQU99709.1 hypothetical protein B2D07_02225 [Desulfococcus multivorans]EPR45036.1 hypothetical protein dsmv_3720 [Desulfococcus multivorans DSM 2059]MDX9818354.1 PqqD family protein [Desulfococcus multivorans]SKA27085.1 Coenzyme PQQ synthesis protein D (PqqD) [Desulfococcus multivorans DSM 2059]